MIKTGLFWQPALAVIGYVILGVVPCGVVHGQVPAAKQSDLAEFLIVRDREAISSSPWFTVVTLQACEITQQKFDELKKLASKKAWLKKLLDRMKNGRDSVALAVFFNQLYPDKKFNPTAKKFSFTYPHPVPVEINSVGRTVMVNVSPEVFGEICSSYWSDRLNIEGHPEPDIESDGADKRRDSPEN